MPKKLTGRVSRLPKGFTEGLANVDGVRINYKVGGRGPVVVLLHGYTQTSHMWTPVMPLLARSHTVIAPDLRGAEGSERTQDGYDKKTLATFEVSCISSVRNRWRWLGTTSA
jgi:pimeloyl-ACP methyl ester carboxylesterase